MAALAVVERECDLAVGAGEGSALHNAVASYSISLVTTSRCVEYFFYSSRCDGVSSLS